MDDMHKHTNDHWILIPQIATSLEARNYLELGVQYGDCLLAVANSMAKMHGSDYHAVGIDRLSDRICQQRHSELGSFEYITMDTLAYLGSAHSKAYGQFDLVFIDADHRAAAVEADFNAVFPLVRDQGVIILHDTFPGVPALASSVECSNAWEFAAKLGTTQEYESMTLPYSPGLTIVRKRTTHLPW